VPAAPAPVWRMQLVGPIGGPISAPTNYGEIAFAKERKFTFNLNKASTIEFKQDLTQPTSDRVLAQAAVGGHILLFQNNNLRMVAELSSVEAVGSADEHSVAVVATETMWVRFAQLAIGNSSAGTAGPASATDQGTFLNNLLAALNADATLGAGWLHTTIGTSGSITASNNITGGLWYSKPFLELVQELGATTAGFDFWQSPADPTTNSGLTGNFNIAPLKGVTKADALLEYGTGRRNAKSYKWKVDSTLLGNYVMGLPPDFPSNATLPIVTAYDTTSIGVRGGRLVIQPTDLNDATLRQNFVNLARDIRKVPRQQFEIQPMENTGDGRVPVPFTDYVTGDRIRGRVVDNGITLLDALVRIYGVEVALSEEGLETDTLVVVNDS
jgi:hypothetical protein